MSDTPARLFITNLKAGDMNKIAISSELPSSDELIDRLANADTIDDALMREIEQQPIVVTIIS